MIRTNIEEDLVQTILAWAGDDRHTAILNSGGWRLKSRLHKQNLPSQVEDRVEFWGNFNRRSILNLELLITISKSLRERLRYDKVPRTEFIVHNN